MLSYQLIPAKSIGSTNVTLVWIHGLLGSATDWLPIIKFMPEWPHLIFDLPGHGDSVGLLVHNFTEMNQQLQQILTNVLANRYVLIGYSLGGRIAMHYACYGQIDRLAGLVIEGGHPGLIATVDRENRLRHDHDWAEKFRTGKMEQVLTEWYQQPIFSYLSAQQRQQMIESRSDNHGEAVAAMLEATTLGHQPWLVKRLQENIRLNNIRFAYFCGEYDEKFRQVAEISQFPLILITATGHNAHHADRQQFVQQLKFFLRED